VRYLALLVLGVVFLTGLVWWVLFIGTAVTSVFRRK
jgi:cytoskeletal protein RodZ